MARIDSYPTIQPRTSDLLLVSDVSEENNPTKTVTISSVLALSSGTGGGLSGSGSTGQVTFWDSSSSITGDNAFFFDNTSKILGLGTITPEASSILDLTSVTKGFLTPRMTEAQRNAIASPAEGLIVYVTDIASGHYVYNGSAWVSLGGGEDSYQSSLSTSTAIPQDGAVGGFTQGTTVSQLNGRTFSQMFDTLLFPTVFPTGSGASTTITNNIPQTSNGLVEAGLAYIVTLSSTANLGTLTNPAGNWAGDVNLATITGPSNTYTPAITPPDRIADVDTPSHSIVLGTTGNTWSLVTRFDRGPMPQDSTGADYPSERFPADGTRTDSTSVEGVYPIYLGNSSGNLVKTNLFSQNATNIACNQNYTETSTVVHQIAVPVAMVTGDITIEVDAGDLGYQLQYPLDPGVPAKWVQSTISQTPNGGSGSVSYYLYTKQSPLAGANNYRINW